ncbi:hypothetical protein KJ780_02765 [Candidatus Micrarchaeota archaeon]|nr:hypothetical protein [Candidatus Micrarchaeota archaeon]
MADKNAEEKMREISQVQKSILGKYVTQLNESFIFGLGHSNFSKSEENHAISTYENALKRSGFSHTMQPAMDNLIQDITRSFSFSESVSTIEDIVGVIQKYMDNSDWPYQTNDAEFNEFDAARKYIQAVMYSPILNDEEKKDLLSTCILSISKENVRSILMWGHAPINDQGNMESVVMSLANQYVPFMKAVFEGYEKAPKKNKDNSMTLFALTSAEGKILALYVIKLSSKELEKHGNDLAGLLNDNGIDWNNASQFLIEFGPEGVLRSVINSGIRNLSEDAGFNVPSLIKEVKGPTKIDIFNERVMHKKLKSILDKKDVGVELVPIPLMGSRKTSYSNKEKQMHK